MVRESSEQAQVATRSSTRKWVFGSDWERECHDLMYAAHIDRQPKLFEREMGCDASDAIFPLSCHRALRLAHLIELLKRDFQVYHSKATRHRWVETGKPIPARVEITFEYEAIAGKENLLRLCVHEIADQEQVDGD